MEELFENLLKYPLEAAIPQLHRLKVVALAFLLGGLIGIEREMADRPAGFRTHMLVAGASALVIQLGDPLLQIFASEDYRDVLRADPFRLFEAIITGVAFLGAGAILRKKRESEVEGLTTAGAILMASAIGICVGLDQYFLSIGVAMLTLISLRVMKFLERWFSRPRGR